MQSKITLIGMYNYDQTLFDKLTFPAGIDKNLAIDRILNKSEEFEVLYSDINYLKDRIGIWGEIWERTFTKWVNALSVDYDPLNNYDRTEIYTDTRNRNYTDENTKDYINNHSRNYEDKQSETSSSMSNTVTGSETTSQTEQKVSAYDEADYSDRQKENAGATTNQTGSGNASGNVTRDGNSNEVSADNSKESSAASGLSNEITQHSAHLFGNIGVTTSQQMLEAELNIATWNLYEHISDIFIDEFCILVY